MIEEARIVARIVDRAHRIVVCPAAPPQLGQVWVATDASCPYCSRPIAEHEEFLALDLKAPEPEECKCPPAVRYHALNCPRWPGLPRNSGKPAITLTDPAQLAEALDLLELWYARWQGYVSGTPNYMHQRTERLLVANDRTPQKGAHQ